MFYYRFKQSAHSGSLELRYACMLTMINMSNYSEVPYLLGRMRRARFIKLQSNAS
jgi:hypothetical protein